MSRGDIGGALFSIGQMAELYGMNVRTLRYYDQIGLLEPEHVNPDTNYRYYSSAQFERLNTIRYLRALGVPIERIAQFFEGRDVALMRGIFEEQLADVEAKRAELERIERKIRARIGRIDQATGSPLGVPEALRMPARRIVSLAGSFAPTADLEPMIRDLSFRSNLHDAIFLGKVGVSISRENLLAHEFGQLSGVFVIVEDEDAHSGSDEKIPAGEFAQIRFRGTHADAAPFYRELLAFIAERNAAVAGDSLETTLIDSGMTSDPAQFVTELQIPIA